MFFQIISQHKSADNIEKYNYNRKHIFNFLHYIFEAKH